MSDPTQKKVVDIEGLRYFWTELKGYFIHEIAQGTNISVSTNNGTVTISGNYSNATASNGGDGGSAGLMSPTDKEKLNWEYIKEKCNL